MHCWPFIFSGFECVLMFPWKLPIKWKPYIKFLHHKARNVLNCFITKILRSFKVCLRRLMKANALGWWDMSTGEVRLTKHVLSDVSLWMFPSCVKRWWPVISGMQFVLRSYWNKYNMYIHPKIYYLNILIQCCCVHVSVYWNCLSQCRKPTNCAGNTW